MYPLEMVKPMIAELTVAGYENLGSAQEVESLLSKNGTTLVVINSVCGCAARNARPAAVAASKVDGAKPDHFVTVFAGVYSEAVAKAREYMLPYPPSSPSMALFKDGQLVHMIERHHIEGRAADMIADNLVSAFEEHCN